MPRMPTIENPLKGKDDIISIEFSGRRKPCCFERKRRGAGENGTLPRYPALPSFLPALGLNDKYRDRHPTGGHITGLLGYRR